MPHQGPTTARTLSSTRGTLTEGLLVRPAARPDTVDVRWVDIQESTVHHAVVDTSSGRGVAVGPVQSQSLQHRASVVLAADDDTVLLGDELGVARLQADGTVTRVAAFAHLDLDMRANDGVLLADGTVLLGTMSCTDPAARPGRIHRFAPGAPVGHPVGPSIHIPNTFLPLEGGGVLVADSLPGQLLLLDAATGATTPHPATVLVPDGTAPDGGCLRAGEVLVALWDGWSLLGFDPVTGRRTRSVPLPVPRPTNVRPLPGCDELVVTTASEGLTPAQLQDAPLSGQVLLVPADQRVP